MTAGPRREDWSGLRARRLLEQRVSRRALLTLSLARGAAVGQVTPPAAASETAQSCQEPRPTPCGACGGFHGPTAVCPVEAQQRALARGFGRTAMAANPAPQFATNEREGGS